MTMPATLPPPSRSAALPPSLIELRRAIASGGLSVAEALARQHARLSQEDSRWHSATHVFPPAPASDANLPLAGVGLAHKDIFAMRGRAPACGASRSPAFPSTTGTVLRRLEAAGSHPLAALSMAEFAAGITGENVNLSRLLNPVDPDAAVGGSSSGSAVAVAAGLCYGSLGTDTAGSVRVPAATCGIVGLKTTLGLLPSSGCFPLAPTLDTIGVLARDAQDAAQILHATLSAAQRKRILPDFMTAHGKRTEAEWDRLAETNLPLRRHWRVAVCLTHPSRHADPGNEHAAALQEAVRSLAPSFDTVRLHDLPMHARNAAIVLHAEAAAVHAGHLRDGGLGLSRMTRALLLPGACLPASWYADAMQQRTAAAKRFISTHLAAHDVLLTPVLPHGVPDWSAVESGSPRFDPRALIALFSWTAFVNYLGLPAVVFPIGSDSKGRPVCLQAIGRPQSEGVLLAFAHQHGHRPKAEATSFPQVQ